MHIVDNSSKSYITMHKSVYLMMRLGFVPRPTAERFLAKTAAGGPIPVTVESTSIANRGHP